jgi:hypothetical protein
MIADLQQFIIAYSVHSIITFHESLMNKRFQAIDKILQYQQQYSIDELKRTSFYKIMPYSDWDNPQTLKKM